MSERKRLNTKPGLTDGMQVHVHVQGMKKTAGKWIGNYIILHLNTLALSPTFVKCISKKF